MRHSILEVDQSSLLSICYCCTLNIITKFTHFPLDWLSRGLLDLCVASPNLSFTVSSSPLEVDSPLDSYYEVLIDRI